MTTHHPRRRFFRYSLRTLLLVVTVFCIWMGITVKRARDQERAVATIEDVGGSVLYDYQIASPSPFPPGPSPPGPKWLRDLIGIHYFDSVAAVLLVGPGVNDECFAAIKRFTDLEILSLFQTKVTDVGLEHLKGLTNLQRLYLNNTRVTDAGLEHLKGLTDLQRLDLMNTNVTDEGIKKLQQALPNCEIIHLAL